MESVLRKGCTLNSKLPQHQLTFMAGIFFKLYLILQELLIFKWHVLFYIFSIKIWIIYSLIFTFYPLMKIIKFLLAANVSYRDHCCNNINGQWLSEFYGIFIGFILNYWHFLNKMTLRKWVIILCLLCI